MKKTKSNSITFPDKIKYILHYGTEVTQTISEKQLIPAVGFEPMLPLENIFSKKCTYICIYKMSYKTNEIRCY